MSDIAIQVENVAKLYHIGEKRAYTTARESMMNVLNAPVRVARKLFRAEPPKVDTTELWALKDVSFTINQGEVVGIIGRNGAGKSTLLKVLSRITEPTRGRIKIHGRVGSLLEVGTGFHPELTGRENIFLNGAILGMRRTEIAGKFDEIVAFSEVERFLDTQVKHYSSGMYMRLAFAVAAHLEPEILVVDEVLAVGDADFQRKCLARMGTVAQGGRTVVFVSHDLAAVRKICSRAALLNKGGVEMIGPTDAVVDQYVANASPASAQISNDVCAINGVDLHDGNKPASTTLSTGESWTINVHYELKRALETGVSLRVASARGVKLFDVHEFIGRAPQRATGKYTTTFDLGRLPLAPGKYLLSVYLMVHHVKAHLIADPLLSFDVQGTLRTGEGSIRTFDVEGVLLVEPSIKTEPHG